MRSADLYKLAAIFSGGGVIGSTGVALIIGGSWAVPAGFAVVCVLALALMFAAL